MNQDRNQTEGSGDLNSMFQATRWSVIFSMAQGSTALAQPAREEFYRIYKHAIYTVIRHRGYSVEDAEDLTQDFLRTHLLERNAFQNADPQRGRFRNFLGQILRNFLNNHFDREHAKKRHPGKPLVSLDDAEEHYRVVAANHPTEEVAFDRQLALDLAGRAMDRLRQRYVDRGRGELFEALKGFLDRGPEPGEYNALAARFQMENKAVTMEVSRLHKRFFKAFYDEVLLTVGNAKEAAEEYRYLLGILRQ